MQFNIKCAKSLFGDSGILRKCSKIMVRGHPQLKFDEPVRPDRLLRAKQQVQIPFSRLQYECFSDSLCFGEGKQPGRVFQNILQGDSRNKIASKSKMCMIKIVVKHGKITDRPARHLPELHTIVKGLQPF